MVSNPKSSCSRLSRQATEPLAVTSEALLAELPDTPTMMEVGVARLSANEAGFACWRAGTPATIVASSNHAVMKH